MSSFERSLQIMALDCNSSITKGETNGNLHSPVTNLAMNLSELRTDRSTPKRRLSLNAVDSGPLLDCFKDSPTPFYSPSEEYRTNPQNPSCLKQNSLTNSETPPLLDLKNLDYVDNSLDTEQDDSNSRDSGLGYEKEREDQFQFVPPLGMPPRKVKMFEDSLDFEINRKFHRSLSAPLIKKEDIEFLQRDNSPKKPENEKDDGFSDHLETMDTAAETVSDSIKSLIEAPLSSQALESTENTGSYKFGRSLDDTPTTMRVAKSIFRTQSFDVRRRSMNKRDRIKDENTPIYQKRRRPANGKISPILKRSHSETEAQIKAAVQRISHNPSLIGDASKTYCLPTITGKHGYLKSVTPQTVKELLHGHYDNEIHSYSIIDCRYPYEFEGGHIKKAENLYDENSIYKKFLENPPKISDSAKRDIVVFHCEFSSERAPKLAKFLRSRDRNANESCYPFLYYPEIYILDGGYKAFFEKCVEFCEPPTYKPMLHSDHSSDLKHFRGKSKSWAGERTHRSGLRQLNF